MPPLAAIPGAVAAVIGAATSVVTTGITAGLSASQAADAKDEANNQRVNQEALLKKQQEDAKTLDQAAKNRDAFTTKQNAALAANAAKGRGDTLGTILTTPIGQIGGYGGKTAIGL